MIKSIGSNWALNALQIGVLMLLTPFVLRTVGDAQNGTWITIVSMTGILRLLVLGVPMASVKSIAEARGRGDLAGVNRAVSTCLAITLGMGAVALAIGGLQRGAFETGYLSGALGEGLTDAQRDAAAFAFTLTAAQVAAAFATRLPYGILEAHDDFPVRNALMAGELLLRAGLIVFLLPRAPTLDTLAWILVATMVAEFAGSWLAVVLRHRGVRLSLASFDRSLVKGILSFSVFAMLLNVGTLLAFRCDALVIGYFIDAEATTQFDMGNKFFEPLLGFVIGIGAVVMPMATRLKAAGRTTELAPALLKWSKISFLLVLFVGLFLLILGPQFLGVWVGPEFRGPAGQVLQVLMLSFLAFMPVRGVALPVLMGLGQPVRPAVALVVMGVVNVIVSVALVKPLGLLGVALGTAIPNVVFSLFVASLACRELGLGSFAFARYVLLRPLVAALPAALALVAYGRFVEVDTWPELIVGGALLAVAYGAGVLLLGLRHDTLIQLPGPLARLTRSA